MKIQMKKYSHWIFVIGLFLLTIISFSIDKYVLNLITLLEHPILDGFFILITNLGIPLAIVIVILLSVPFTKKWKETYLLLFAVIFASAVALSIKAIFMRERPDDIFVSLNLFLNYSFPSMHTTIVFALLPVLNVLFPKKKPLFITIAVLIAASRIYLRVHFLSDVLFGAAIGYMIGLILIPFKDNVFFTNPFKFARQIIHAVLGIVIACLIYFELFPNAVVIPIIILGFALSYVCLKTRIPVISFILEKLERKDELERFPGMGVVMYFLGALIAVNVFPKDIAAASMMILALGDPVSHVIGRHYGRTKANVPFSKQKFLEGTIFAIFTAFAGAVFFVHPLEAIFASTIAMIIEAIEIKVGQISVDDNAIIPIISGGIMLLVRFLI